MIRPVDIAVQAAQAAGTIQRQRAGNFGRVESVSYTHLTLPTKRTVHVCRTFAP